MLTVNLGYASVEQWNLIVGSSSSMTTSRSTIGSRLGKCHSVRMMNKSLVPVNKHNARVERWIHFPVNASLNSLLGRVYSFHIIYQTSSEDTGNSQNNFYSAIPELNNKLEFIYEVDSCELRMHANICIINYSEAIARVQPT